MGEMQFQATAVRSFQNGKLDFALSGPGGIPAGTLRLDLSEIEDIV
jgi:hypothetical protein